MFFLGILVAFGLLYEGNKGSDTVLIVNLLIHWCTISFTAFVDCMGNEQEFPCRGNPRHLLRLTPFLQSKNMNKATIDEVVKSKISLPSLSLKGRGGNSVQDHYRQENFLLASSRFMIYASW